MCHQVKNLFVIDDDRDDIYLLSEAVQTVDKSINFFSTTDGERGIDWLKTGHVPQPDVIFLDINMPRWNGEMVLAELRKNRSLDNTPVIMFSTSSSLQEMGKFMKKGANDFITKPSSYTELINTLSILLARHAPAG